MQKLFDDARDEVVFALEHDREVDALKKLPLANPYSLEQILDLDRLPPEAQARP